MGNIPYSEKLYTWAQSVEITSISLSDLVLAIIGDSVEFVSTPAQQFLHASLFTHLKYTPMSVNLEAACLVPH